MIQRRVYPEDLITALPLDPAERGGGFTMWRDGGARRRIPRPDGGGFTRLPDDEDPPIARMFDSYEMEI